MQNYIIHEIVDLGLTPSFLAIIRLRKTCSHSIECHTICENI